MKNLILILSIFFTHIAGLNANPFQCKEDTKEPGTKCHMSPTPVQFQQIIARDAKRAKAGKNTAKSMVRNIPVKIHILRRTDGTGGLALSKALADIASANIIYSQAEFNFYVCGAINYIDDDSFYSNVIRGNVSSEIGLANSNKIADALNVFYCPNTIPAISWASKPIDLIDGKDWIIVNNQNADNQNSFSYLVGWWLDLIRTDFGFPFGIDEHVTRNPNSTCYNCETAGDLLCDTPADNGDGFTASCTYNGTATNPCDGLAYAPLTDNVMSISNNHCRSAFTAEQINRMQVCYDLDRTAIHNPTSCPVACATDTYEPNNKMFEANYLGSDNAYTLSDLCIAYGGDQDYFKVKASGQTFYINVRGNTLEYNSVGEYKLKYTATNTTLTIETAPNNSSNVDTYLHLYTGSGNEIVSDNNGGVALFSKIVYTLPTCDTPSPIENFTSNISHSSAKLKCTTPGSYRDFRYKISTSTYWKNVSHTPNNYKNITALESNTTYYWQSRVYCAGGPWSAWSSTEEFTTLAPCVPPSEVENYTSDIKQNSARLNCSKTGKFRDFRYRVSGTPVWNNFPATSASYIDITGLSPNTYFWQSRVYCPQGVWSGWSSTESFKIYNSFAPTTPVAYLTAFRNFPNPFNGETTIEFDLEQEATVTLIVSDITGKQIQVLLNNEQRSPGLNQVSFNGENHPAGIYYYSMRAGEHLVTRKMILIK